MNTLGMTRVSDVLWELPATGGMRVPGRVYADSELLAALEGDQSLTQVRNVAHLPGILRYSLAMPDIHFGYGFPIGGVAAFSVENGVVSPGGVGYDINCGCRLLATDLQRSDIEPKLKTLVDQLFRDVPSGVGSSGAIAKLPRKELERLLVKGAAWAVEQRLRESRPTSITPRREAHCRAPIRRPSASARTPEGSTRSARWARATTSSRSRRSTRYSTAKPRRHSGSARAR